MLPQSRLQLQLLVTSLILFGPVRVHSFGCGATTPQCCADTAGATKGEACKAWPTEWAGTCCTTAQTCCLKFPKQITWTISQKLGNYVSCDTGDSCQPVNPGDTSMMAEYTCKRATVITGTPPTFKTRSTKRPTFPPVTRRPRPTPLPGCRACCLADQTQCPTLTSDQYTTSCCASRGQCCQTGARPTAGSFTCCGAGQTCGTTNQDIGLVLAGSTTCIAKKSSCPACCLGGDRCEGLPISAGSCCGNLNQCCQTGADPYTVGTYQCCSEGTECVVTRRFPRAAKCLARGGAGCPNIKECGKCTLGGCTWMPELNTCAGTCIKGVKECLRLYNQCPIDSASLDMKTCKGRCNAGGAERAEAYQSFAQLTTISDGDPLGYFSANQIAYNYFPKVRLGPGFSYYGQSSAVTGLARNRCLCDKECEVFGDCCADRLNVCGQQEEKGEVIKFPLYFKYADNSIGPCQTTECTCAKNSAMPANSFSMSFDGFGVCTSYTYTDGNTFYMMLIKNPYDNHYDITSFGDEQCSRQIAGTTSFSYSALDGCIDGPKKSNSKFRVYDSSSLYLSPNINKKAKMEFPLLYQFTFGSNCIDPNKCSCKDQSIFPEASWSASYSQANKCVETKYEGKNYWSDIAANSDGTYQIRSFSDSKCMNQVPGFISVDPSDMCKCVSAINGKGHYRVCSEKPKLPIIFQWSPPLTLIKPCGLPGSDDFLRNYMGVEFEQADTCTTTRYTYACSFPALECGLNRAKLGTTEDFHFKLVYNSKVGWSVKRYTSITCLEADYTGEYYPFLMQNTDKQQCRNANNLRNEKTGAVIIAKYKAALPALKFPVVFSWDRTINMAGCTATTKTVGQIESAIHVGFTKLEECVTNKPKDTTQPARHFMLGLASTGLFTVTEYTDKTCSAKTTTAPFTLTLGPGKCHNAMEITTNSIAGVWSLVSSTIDKNMVLWIYSGAGCTPAGGCMQQCRNPAFRRQGNSIALELDVCNYDDGWIALRFQKDGTYAALEYADRTCTGSPVKPAAASFTMYDVDNCFVVESSVLRIDNNGLKLPVKYHIIRDQDCTRADACYCRADQSFTGPHQQFRFDELDACITNNYGGITRTYKLILNWKGVYEVKEFSDFRCTSPSARILSSFQKIDRGLCLTTSDKNGRAFIERSP